MCERTFLPFFFLKDGIKDDGDETKFINLKVMSQDKTEVHFKIKRTTPMLKVSQYPATLLGGVQNPWLLSEQYIARTMQVQPCPFPR